MTKQPVKPAARVRTIAVVAIVIALAATTMPVRAGASGPDLTKARLLTLAGVPEPPAGIGLRVHISFGEGSNFTVNDTKIVSLDAVIDPAGDLEIRRLTSVEDVRGPASPLPDPVIYECADPTFEPSGYAWDKARVPIAWQFRWRSVPKRLNRRAVLRDVKKAFRIWPKAASACPQKSDSSLAIVYAGRTRRTVKLDGINTVEMARLSGGALAATYQWYDGLQIIESDVRMARGAGWATTVRIRPKRHFFVGTGSRRASSQSFAARSARRYRKYFVANAMALEAGNLIGLTDLADPHGDLSMFALVARGEKKKLTLGTGDVLGASVTNP